MTEQEDAPQVGAATHRPCAACASAAVAHQGAACAALQAPSAAPTPSLFARFKAAVKALKREVLAQHYAIQVRVCGAEY